MGVLTLLLAPCPLLVIGEIINPASCVQSLCCDSLRHKLIFGKGGGVSLNGSLEMWSPYSRGCLHTREKDLHYCVELQTEEQEVRISQKK